MLSNHQIFPIKTFKFLQKMLNEKITILHKDKCSSLQQLEIPFILVQNSKAIRLLNTIITS